ncbi:MAG: hypothetical protein IPH84_00595 [Bacteroidales bacterium]|nr:hypothetical protein [Bacteroidales bacterium]
MSFIDLRLFSKFSFMLLLFVFLFNLQVYSQVSTRKSSPSDVSISPDSITSKKIIPDDDRDDIPFIDYQPAVIWTTSIDTLRDFAYIRKNFTDQLLSVWSVPGRYYPASRIYAAEIGGNYYRACKVSADNYVFAQQLVKGKMNLYAYRIIPQTNGWVEMVSHDPENGVYRNNMIIEIKGMRRYWKRFGYMVTLAQDSSTMISLSQETLKEFSEKYLKETPEAYTLASKFSNQKRQKITRGIAVGIVVGAILVNMTNLEESKYLLLASFPLAITLALLNRANALHPDDMVRIVELYNREKLAKGLEAE